MTYEYYELLSIDEATARSRVRDPTRLPPVVGDDEAWWRPRELLVHVDAVDELAGLLADVGAVPFGPKTANWRNRDERQIDPEYNDRLVRASGHQLWVIPADVDTDIDVREVVEKGRDSLGRRERSLTLNTVFVGEGYYMGGPGAAVAPADEPAVLPAVTGATELPEVTVSVLDTGIPVDWDNQRYRLRAFINRGDIDAPAEMDLLDSDGNAHLDRQAAHGLFVCGLITRVSGDVRIDPDRVLDPFGLGSEDQIIQGLQRSTGAVVNLSLGGYTMNNEIPAALASTIDAIVAEDRVVVAAAGNNHADESKRGLPFYPAALPGVIAVGAYDSGTDLPADFSNRGHWVDVWAPGVGLVSDFVSAWPIEPAPGSALESLSGRGRLGVARDWWIEILRRRARRSYLGWARWSGTSFAAPLVSAEIARRIVADPATPRRVTADAFIASLSAVSWPDVTGALFVTADFTA